MKTILAIAQVIEEVSEEDEKTPHHAKKDSSRDSTPQRHKRTSSLRSIVDWLASNTPTNRGAVQAEKKSKEVAVEPSKVIVEQLYEQSESNIE